MKRFFDIFFAILLIMVFFIPMSFISITILITSRGPLIYWSQRNGINDKIFSMPKFRSMKIETPELATHLMKNPEKFISPIGSFLRKSSFDELPQLFSIIKGDMTFVGPRPALFNQYDLINLRAEKNLNKLKPGLTGWAQVNGRDNLSIEDKVELELEYMNNQSFFFDLQILWRTFLKVLRMNGVSH